jgi:hypothetical protein
MVQLDQVENAHPADLLRERVKNAHLADLLMTSGMLSKIGACASLHFVVSLDPLPNIICYPLQSFVYYVSLHLSLVWQD